jgi:rhodanese-related sulfurtransferase
VVVDKAMRTSDPDIFAGGNLVEVENLVTGKPAYFPLGSMANRQGRVIGTNLAGAGEDATFDGAVGTFAVKLFELSVAGTGLTAESARRAGFDAVGVHVVQFDRAHFYPDKDLMSLDLVVERGTGRVLGLQGIGADLGVIGRIDAVAALLTSKRAAAHVSDVSNLEVAYSPPFSSAMDILNAVGNVAENTLAGRNRTVGVDGFCQLWDNRDQGDTLFLDCRGWGNAEPYAAKYPEHWKSVPQDELRERLAEVPRDKKLVLICNTGVRSYEAQRYLDECGITDTLNVEGGMAAIKKWGLEL